MTTPPKRKFPTDGGRPAPTDDAPPPVFRERAPWLGGDLQTVRNQLFRERAPLPGASREMWFDLSDGDRMTGMLDTPERPNADAPLILLVHGLTGDEDSVYMRASARWNLSRGRRVLRLNLRGAGRSKPYCQGMYHAGRAPDLEEVVASLPGGLVGDGVFVIGFSLGGAIAVNWAGQFARPDRIVGAAAISAPLDPLEASMRIGAPRNWPYQAWLLREMRQQFLASPAPLDAASRAAAQAARSVFTFDDVLVAPQNGYAGAADYYARTAALPWAAQTRTPLLVIHADNDPWIPARAHRALASEASATNHVRVVVTRGGGHVGFHAPDMTTPWHNLAIDAFMRDFSVSFSVR